MTKTLTEQQIRKIIENGTEQAAKVCKQKFYDKPKSLTEQWREGKLPEGYYYTKLNDDDGTIDINYCWDDGCFQDYCDNMVEEVLAPVPSYDEHNELMQKMHILEKKLAIATKALKEYADQDKWSYCSEDIDYFYSTKPGYRDAEKALEEMEGVK